MTSHATDLERRQPRRDRAPTCQRRCRRVVSGRPERRSNLGLCRWRRSPSGRDGDPGRWLPAFGGTRKESARLGRRRSRRRGRSTRREDDIGIVRLCTLVLVRRRSAERVCVHVVLVDRGSRTALGQRRLARLHRGCSSVGCGRVGGDDISGGGDLRKQTGMSFVAWRGDGAGGRRVHGERRLVGSDGLVCGGPLDPLEVIQQDVLLLGLSGRDRSKGGQRMVLAGETRVWRAECRTPTTIPGWNDSTESLSVKSAKLVSSGRRLTLQILMKPIASWAVNECL